MSVLVIPLGKVWTWSRALTHVWNWGIKTVTGTSGCHRDIFFLKFLADTCPFLGPLVPLFWISGDVSSGFQSQSGFCLIRYFCGGKCNVHSPRFTSGATLADLLVAGAQPVTSPHAWAEVGIGSNVQPHEQKTNALPLCQRPGLSSWHFTFTIQGANDHCSLLGKSAQQRGLLKAKTWGVSR